MAQSPSLSDFCTIVQGGRHGLSGNHFVPNGYPAYGAGGINGFLETYEFERPAVVLSSIGARCGKCFYANGRWSSLANTQIIIPDYDKADTKFLWYQLNNESRWHRSGTGQPFIKPSDVKAHKVFLPPLPEQRRIAAILDQADALRAKRREALAQLDSLTQSIFTEMFGDPIANSRNLPQAKLGESTVFENGDRSSNYPSGDEIKDAGVLFLSTKNIREHRLDLSTTSFITEEKFASLSRGKARKNDLLITLRGTLGSCCIFNGPYETAFINAQMMIIRPKAILCPQYLHALLTSQQFQDLFSRIGQGAAVPQLTATQLGQLSILVPPIDEQMKFVSRILSAEGLKREQEQHLSMIDCLFASLQHRAFRGEL
jgi:type I restriction enzyme S subunit